MAQVKNEEEKKKNTTKKVTKKATTAETLSDEEIKTAEPKKTTSKTSTKGTAKRQTTTKKSNSASKTRAKAKVNAGADEKVAEKEIENEEAITKVEETKTKKETKTRSTKKASTTKSDTKKKTGASKEKKATTSTKTADKATKKASAKASKKSSSKDNKLSKVKGKITKIIGSKKLEEQIEEDDDVVITDANEDSIDIVKIDDEEKLQIVENEVKKDLKSKNKLPKTEEKKLSSVVFENLCVAIAVMIYLFFMILGFINIKEEVYNVDLKVFSFITLIIAILLFERAYKKDSGKLCAFGIETLFLAIVTMGLLYVNIELQNIFLPIAASISMIFAIYYVAKSIYLYSKLKKKYFVDNMRDIIQKEEKE